MIMREKVWPYGYVKLLEGSHISSSIQSREKKQNMVDITTQDLVGTCISKMPPCRVRVPWKEFQSSKVQGRLVFNGDPVVKMGMIVTERVGDLALDDNDDCDSNDDGDRDGDDDTQCYYSES